MSFLAMKIIALVFIILASISFIYLVEEIIRYNVVVRRKKRFYYTLYTTDRNPVLVLNQRPALQQPQPKQIEQKQRKEATTTTTVVRRKIKKEEPQRQPQPQPQQQRMVRKVTRSSSSMDQSGNSQGFNGPAMSSLGQNRYRQ